MRHRTVFLVIALSAALIFGITVLVGGDWLPGVVIVASAIVGLAAQLRLGSRSSTPSSPSSAR